MEISVQGVNQKAWEVSKMPGGDGTGPRGRGGATGRGQGGRGRGGGFGTGSDGDCVCPVCGFKMAHQAGVRCFQMRCPKCSALISRERVSDIHH